jgi:DNA-binding transcriptional LysR family regulator
MYDVRRLRLLHGLATHGTVAATAEALRLTGPAVSQQLAALEREAGVPLLVKRGRTLALTDAGRLLVSHAEVILGDLAAAEADLARLSGAGAGTVRLAAFPSAARTLVASAWAAVSTMDGGVELRLLEMEPELSIEALRRQRVDIAVVHSYSLLPRDLPAGVEQQHPLMTDPVLLALPGARDVEPGAPVRLADFAAERWLAPDRAVSCYEMTQRACGAAGFVPRVVAEATDFSVLVALVAAGAGVALVPRLALPDRVSDRPAGISLHQLVDPVTRHIFALTRAGTARLPAIRAVLDALRSG